MVLRLLHFLLYPFEMSTLSQTVHFLSWCTACMTLIVQFMISVLATLSIVL